jgi:hypothetical protein
MSRRLSALFALSVSSAAYLPSAGLPWPDPAFLPERQCRGRLPTEDLQRFLGRARLALWLPGTRAVNLDLERRCITVTVESVGGGRLAELVMRGVAVPRGAILLQLAESAERRG